MRLATRWEWYELEGVEIAISDRARTMTFLDCGGDYAYAMKMM